MLRAVANSLSSIVFPQNCRVCSREVNDIGDGVACVACWSETRFFTGHEMLCRKCGAFFSSERGPAPVSCKNCDDHHYGKAVALGVYEKALAASVVALKTVPHLPSRLIALIEAAAETTDILMDADVLLPVPLSRLRRHERGFNQADVIAKALSRATGVPVDNLSLARKVHTQMHRMGMDQKARELTIHNAFEVRRPKLIAGKKIVVVDDVLTSGATASQAAKTLIRHGARQVNVFTLARAVLH